MLNHSISTQLNQLDLFGLSPIKNAALAEQAPKPVVKPKDPEHLFKIISRMELMPDGSRKHYDGTGRLCLHSHAPEPKNYAYRTDNAGTTRQAKARTSKQPSHGAERNRHIRQKITALTTGAMSQELSVAEKYCAYCSKWVSTERAGLLGFVLTPCCNRSWEGEV